MSDLSLEAIDSPRKKAPSAARILTVSGLGLLFDSMDNSLLSFVLVALMAQWHIGSGMAGFLGSVSFIGMAVGSALAGLFADRFGRRNIFMWTLLIYSLATGATALAGGVGVFIIMRFLVGFGLGGELPVATTYVLESSPEHVRGRRVVFLESFWAIGALVASIVSYFILPSVGWRVVFLVGALPALYVFGLRFGLPEAKGYTLLRERPKMSTSLKTVFDDKHLRATVVTWILWFIMNFAYYGIFLWLPSVMSLKGYSLVHSIGYVLVMTIAQVPGYLMAAWLVEVWGRKRVLVTAIILAAFSALAFGLAQTTVWLVIFGICVSFFMLAAFAGTYIFTVEQFPTFARASGMGWAAGFGRIGGIIAPFLVGMLIANKVPFSVIFGIFFVAMAIAFIVVGIWGRETKGQNIG